MSPFPFDRLHCVKTSLLVIATVFTPLVEAHHLGDADHAVGPSEPSELPRIREVSGDDTAVGAKERGGAGAGSPILDLFTRYTPTVRVRSVGQYLLVESQGLPSHGMMAGITVWQQQVPLPQPYVGVNAWRIPLYPEPSPHPVSIRNRFLRGAIALAANGIPIFNPQNNRGEVSFAIGELDRWGGHCGRSDDYHYHIAPLHLQERLGPHLPIACALDGYPIYGLTEPDGALPKGLDAFNGHETEALGYHYHASTTYPFVNGGFHGVVTERDGQVDPQPRARGVRPALTALRGANITGFVGTPGPEPSTLTYTVNARPAFVTYAETSEGRWRFRFVGADGTIRDEVYSPRAPGGGGGRRSPEARKAGEEMPIRDPLPAADSESRPKKSARSQTVDSGSFSLRCPEVGADGILPVEFTGDGAGISPPLEWRGAPAGTTHFAVIMHHVDPQGHLKWYWTLYNVPASASGLPKAAQGICELGNNSVTHRPGYAPPHSKGPGAKVYLITVYAISGAIVTGLSPHEMDREKLINAMQGRILATAEIQVVSSRLAVAGRSGSDDREAP